MESSHSNPLSLDAADGERFADPYDDATIVGSPASLTARTYPHGLTSRELAHALRGEMLNHFLLQEFIGGGGMGVVFKALDTTLDRIVAVKVVASHRMDSEDLQRRFLIEAQSTARLDHPNIARIHYIGRDRGLPYIVFEYIDGVNVRDLVAEQGTLAVEEAVSYAYQIAHALAHAWKRDVVHRDIKPSNILVTDDGEAKLVDMGLARLRQIDAEQEEDLTATGITLGTFDYISPEQARDPRIADCRSDIYSLGCTIFFMLAGQAPFSRGTAVQKLLQHQNDKPPDLSEFRSDVPDTVSRLVRRMLEKDPADRPQSPVELVHELAVILSELGVRMPYALAPMPMTSTPRSHARRRRHAVWATPVALAIGAGFVIDALDREQAAESPFAPLQVIEAPGDETTTPTKVVASPTQPPSPQPKASAGLESSAESLEIGRPWNFGDSLWRRLNDWPAREPAPALESLMHETTGEQAAAASPRPPSPPPRETSTRSTSRPGPPAPRD